MSVPSFGSNTAPDQEAQPRKRWHVTVFILGALIGVSLTIALSYVTYWYFISGRASSGREAVELTEAAACEGPYLSLLEQLFMVQEIPSSSGSPADILSGEQGVAYLLYSQNGRYTFGLTYPQELKSFVDNLEIGAAAHLQRPDCSVETLSLLAVEHLLLGGLSGRFGDPAGAILFVLADPAVEISPEEEPIEPVLITDTPTPTQTHTPTITPTLTITPTSTLTPTSTMTGSPEPTGTETATPSETITPNGTPTATGTLQPTDTVP